MTARSTARCYFSAAHVAYQEFLTPTRLERDADGLSLEFAEHAEELVWLACDPPAREQLPVAGEHSDVRGLAVQVHSDVDHDRASFLSFVLGGRYDVRVVNTGAEARSFMASEE